MSILKARYTLLLTLLISNTALAAALPEETFQRLDINGNGQISQVEAAEVPDLAEHFDKVDANRDNVIDPIEFKSLDEVMAGVAEAGGDREPPGAGLLVRASQILGRSITNSKGEEVGQVEDVVVYWPGGQMAYVVLSYGGVLGLGEKLIALPPEALLVGSGGMEENYERYTLQTSLSEEELEEMEGFTEESWPSAADPKIIEHTRQGERFE